MSKLTPDDVLALAPVVPVVTLHDADDAVPLARALLAGGIRTIEITLRTPAALDAMRNVARDAPELVVGAGTVLTRDDLEAVIDAGARYAISPGATPKLLKAARKASIPFVPGVASASDIMRAQAMGFHALKFFPAEALGGAEALKHLAGPLPGVRFWPTGGIGVDKVASYLALPCVGCVGGSWIAPTDKIKARDWGAIEALAQKAAWFSKS